MAMGSLRWLRSSQLGLPPFVPAGPCFSALYLPHCITTHMEAEPRPVTIVVKLIFDLSARDRLIASRAYVTRSVTGKNTSRHHHRQPTVLDALADAQP